MTTQIETAIEALTAARRMFGTSTDPQYFPAILHKMNEAIAALAPAALPDALPELQIRALVEENRKLTAKANEWRDKFTESEESRAQLLVAFNRATGGDTLMGEPILADRRLVQHHGSRYGNVEYRRH